MRAVSSAFSDEVAHPSPVEPILTSCTWKVECIFRNSVQEGAFVPAQVKKETAAIAARELQVRVGQLVPNQVNQ